LEEKFKKKQVSFQKIPDHAVIFVVEELPLTSSLSCLQKAPKKAIKDRRFFPAMITGHETQAHSNTVRTRD